ncbi:hypothetical protein LINGRAHAP2_LOCUS30399 [Linum grandiflorum]
MQLRKPKYTLNASQIWIQAHSSSSSAPGPAPSDSRSGQEDKTNTTMSILQPLFGDPNIVRST